MRTVSQIEELLDESARLREQADAQCFSVTVRQTYAQRALAASTEALVRLMLLQSGLPEQATGGGAE
jgi:hypothetical protein